MPRSQRSPAVAAHVLGICTSLLGPLLMYLTVRKDPPNFARTQVAEALNFQLSLSIVTIATFNLALVLWPVAWVCCPIGAVRAASGHPYRYPLAFRLIR